MDLNGQFYYVKDNKPVGPFSLDELLEKNLSNKTYIWTKGMTNWEKIESIPVILERINNNKNQPPVFIEPKREGNNVTQKGKGLKKLFWFAFLGILVVVIGVVALNLKKDEPLKVEIPVKETIENDLKKENLKGEVIYIKYETPISNELEGHKEFNSKGFRTKYTFGVTTYPALSSETEYFYEDEKIVKSIITQLDGIDINTYTYGTDGKLLKETTVNRDFSIKTVDYKYSGGLLIESIENSKKDLIISKYFYSTKKLDSIITKKTNLIDKITEFKYLYFNEKGQKIKLVNLDKVTTVEYNDFNEVKKDVTDGVETVFTYILDEKGNWIERYKNGKINDIRRIFYKGDDLTTVKNDLLIKKKEFFAISDDSDSGSQTNQSLGQSNNNSTSSNSFANAQKIWNNYSKSGKPTGVYEGGLIWNWDNYSQRREPIGAYEGGKIWNNYSKRGEPIGVYEGGKIWNWKNYSNRSEPIGAYEGGLIWNWDNYPGKPIGII